MVTIAIWVNYFGEERIYSFCGEEARDSMYVSQCFLDEKHCKICIFLTYSRQSALNLVFPERNVQGHECNVTLLSKQFNHDIAYKTP